VKIGFAASARLELDNLRLVKRELIYRIGQMVRRQVGTDEYRGSKLAFLADRTYGWDLALS
jgi:hypothetical protein